MKPLDFYRLGIEFARNSTTEPLQRTVVNRLYYGLHHEACCRYFRVNPASNPLDRNRRHTDLRNRFNELDDPIPRSIGGLLHNLMLLRGEADYRLVPPFRFRQRPLNAQQLSDWAVEFARQLLDALEAFSPGEAEDGCNCPEAYTVR